MAESIMGHYPLSEEELKTYSPLSFAYVGDAVYEIMIRTMLVTNGNRRATDYHKAAIGYVNAAGQTQMMSKIQPLLSEEELAIFKRGKNAKPASTAKNQSLHDYRIATGFETLVGYLYLAGRKERLLELINAGVNGE